MFSCLDSNNKLQITNLSDLMFNCPDVSPTIEQIDQSFGATRPGVYDEERRRFDFIILFCAFANIRII